MTVIDNTTRTDADFAARIAHMLEQPDAPESWAATVERMARAMWVSDGLPEDTFTSTRAVYEGEQTRFRRLATAALRVVTEPADGAA